MDESKITLAVIMECMRLANKWVDCRWEAIGVVPQPSDASGGEARKLVEERDRTHWIFPGLELRLRADEAEDYLLNVTAPEPRVFVIWRMEGGLARPAWITAAYGSAARSADAGEQVDGVAMPRDLRDWVEGYARAHYRPPEKTGGRFAATRRGSGSR